MHQAALSVYTVTPRQAIPLIIDCLEAGLVPFLQSSPGMGKSSIFRVIAKMLNLYLIDHRLSTSNPVDIAGAPWINPETGEASFRPFTDIFPIEGMEVPKGYDGYLLFFDEANSATKAVQAAAYKPVLDKMVGQKRLHERTVLAMAGNLITDRAIVQALSTAMQSRVVHLKLRVDFNEWLEDVAYPEEYDGRVISYLKYKNGAPLMDFDPDRDESESTFCCPRTWEFQSRLMKGKVFNKTLRDDGTIHYEIDSKIPLYAGTITSGVACDLVQFTKVNIPSIKEILADPMGLEIPFDGAARWATIGHITEFVTEQNFETLAKFAERFPLELRIVFFRSVMPRQPKLRHHPAFAERMIELQRYLNPPS